MGHLQGKLQVQKNVVPVLLLVPDIAVDISF